MASAVWVVLGVAIAYHIIQSILGLRANIAAAKKSGLKYFIVRT